MAAEHLPSQVDRYEGGAGSTAVHTTAQRRAILAEQGDPSGAGPAGETAEALRPETARRH